MNNKLLLRLIKWGIYAVPITVLLYWETTIFPFVTLKVFSFFVLVEILALLWLWLFWIEPTYRPRKSWLNILLLTFLGVMIASAFLGFNPARSFWSVQSRAIGLVALLHYYAYFLVLITFVKEINWSKYLNFLFWVSVVAAGSAFVGRFLPDLFYSTGGDRPGGVLGNPAYLGAYLVICIFLGLWLASQIKNTKSWYKWALYGGVLFEVSAIFLGNTRGAILGLVIGFGAILVYKALRGYRAKMSVKKNTALILLIVLVIFGGTVWLTRQANIWQSIPGFDRVTQISLEDTTTNNRLIAWKSALGAFSEHPVLGWGFENFRYAFDARYEPTLLRSGFSETYWDKPHNIFLEMLVTSGVLGLGLFLAVIIMAFYIVLRLSPRDFRPYGLGLLLAYLIQGMVTFDTFGSYLMLFIVFAFLHNYEVANKGETESKPASKNLRLGLAAMGTVVVLMLIVVNVKAFYANKQFYFGLNYYVQQYPEEGFDSFNRAMAINQPYTNEIKAEFLSVITQMIQQYSIPENPKKHIDVALVKYSDALGSDPNNYLYYSRLADARTAFFQVDKKYLDGAWEAINRAMELSPNRQQSFYVTSKIKLLEGDLEGSFAEMEKAIALDPMVAEPHLYYGMLRFQATNDPSALDEIRKAMSMGRAPKNVQEARILGGYFGDTEDYEMAEYFFEYAVQYDPEDIEGGAKLAIVYYYNGKLDKSKELFSQILEDLPEDWYGSSYYLQLKPILDDLGL